MVRLENTKDCEVDGDRNHENNDHIPIGLRLLGFLLQASLRGTDVVETILMQPQGPRLTQLMHMMRFLPEELFRTKLNADELFEFGKVKCLQSAKVEQRTLFL